ncbi:MAG: hypothetical protein HC803_03065 [Saprospiraceae bacterium]|nr:hypothetical protein [Saprospiraceae bacterium]
MCYIFFLCKKKYENEFNIKRINQFENDLKRTNENVGENAENNFREYENDDDNENEILIDPTFQAVILHQSNESKQVETFEKFMGKLKAKHENYSQTELINACLVHATENEGAIWQRSLNTFLKRLKKENNDN